MLQSIQKRGETPCPPQFAGKELAQKRVDARTNFTPISVHVHLYLSSRFTLESMGANQYPREQFLMSGLGCDKAAPLCSLLALRQMAETQAHVQRCG